jgi:gliding motility-associated-like protein
MRLIYYSFSNRNIYLHGLLLKMSFKKILFFVLFVFACNSVFSATFIVTSKADAGPGTLRQALLDAAGNGTAQLDYINFNLPGVTQADVTITLQTQLPDVTANVIIDGTTQPGLFLGVSNAKVIITPATPAQNFNAFNVSPQVGVNDAVEFYGLYIKGFSPGSRGLGSAIITSANCKLVIGAPGKGNVISGNWYAVLGYLQNAIIQSNFIGVDIDGETGVPNWSILYSGQDYNNLLIGGPVAADGNTIVGGNDDGIDFGGVSGGNTSKTVTIQNNFFGTDARGIAIIRANFNPFILVNDASSTLNITGNVFSSTQPAISAFNQATIVVKGNFFGTDKTETYPLGQGSEAIDENTSINATIGGTADADQNVFTNYQNPIFAVNNSTTNVIKNRFYCNTLVELTNTTSNFIRIIGLTDNSVSGDAPAGATVQLYYSTNKCSSCNPNTWFATVTANGSGKWSYSGNTTQNVMASSTVSNNTVGFQPYSIQPEEVTVTNYDCHHAGSLEIVEKRSGRFQFAWKDANGTLKGTQQKVDGLAPGDYTLEISEAGSCPIATGRFTIIDLTPQAYSSSFQLDCSNPTAYFTAYTSTGPNITVAKYFWANSAGVVFSNNSEVSGLTAGKYYLYITDSNGCNSATVEFDVNAAINTPVIDDSKATPHDANCDFSDGSITGLQLSNAGNANYGWSKADGSQTYPMQLDLQNVPAGDYYFFVNYSFSCPVIKSRVFTVGSANGITMDESGETPTASTCSNSNGGIKGIITTGANKFQWFNNDTKLVAGNTVDLTGVPAGTYYLIASNAVCSKQSQNYPVTNIAAVDNYTSTPVIVDATCDENNGSVTVTFDPATAPKSYRWTDATGTTTLFTDAALTGQPGGDYKLYVTDNNGCESFYKSYTINSTPLLQIVQGSEVIMNDECSRGIGSIKKIQITGGVPPYAYIWTDDANPGGFSHSLDNSFLKPGVYTLTVTDATLCGVATQSYTVINETSDLATPDVSNLNICGGGDVIFKVNNAQTGFAYRVYNDATSSTVLGDQVSGLFHLSINSSRSIYVTQYNGSCESARVEVKIIIGLSTVTIPNTFTPNGDGINDFWLLSGIESYPEALVQVFNRYGQKVFESRGYNHPFDGNMGNSKLPVGVYYYIVTLNSTCNLLSGSLTLLR